jgi:hypothetical protein
MLLASLQQYFVIDVDNSARQTISCYKPHTLTGNTTAFTNFQLWKGLSQRTRQKRWKTRPICIYLDQSRRGVDRTWQALQLPSPIAILSLLTSSTEHETKPLADRPAAVHGSVQGGEDRGIRMRAVVNFFWFSEILHRSSHLSTRRVHSGFQRSGTYKQCLSSWICRYDLSI